MNKLYTVKIHQYNSTNLYVYAHIDGVGSLFINDFDNYADALKCKSVCEDHLCRINVMDATQLASTMAALKAYQFNDFIGARI